MKVKIEGQFLENGSFTRKNGDVCDYAVILVGATAQQVSGIKMPPDTKYLQKVTLDCDIRAYQGQLICNAL